MIRSRKDKPFKGSALQSNARKAALTCQAVGIALSPFLSLQPVFAQVTPSGTVPRADTTNTTILPTDVVPLAGAQERTNFGENLQLRIMQRLPSRFYFSTSFELTERYESNPFQFPTKRELLKQLPPPQTIRVLDAFNQARINDIIGLVNNDDAIFRLLPNVSAGWTVTPHTRLFTNYFMIRDQLAHNIRLNTIIHSLGAGIQHDIPIGQKGSLQFELQGRELWQLHQQSVFDFLPGATFSYILNPKTVLFVNSLVQMRGKAFMQAPTKEIDPFYTWGGLHQRNGWTFTASTTFVQNFREPFRGNATIPRNNYVFICDFEIARRILKAYPGLQAFCRIEPIYNFKSDDTPGLAGMDFRAFFGFRFAMAKPALTATLEQIRQQLEETETTTPKNNKPGTKPSAYDFPAPHELIAHNPQPIHGFLAKAGLEETAINPDGEQPVLIADNQPGETAQSSSEEAAPASEETKDTPAEITSAPESEESQTQPQGSIAEQIADDEGSEVAQQPAQVDQPAAPPTPPATASAPKAITKSQAQKIASAPKANAKPKAAPAIPNIGSKQVPINDLLSLASGQGFQSAVSLDGLHTSIDSVVETDTSSAVPQPIQNVSHSTLAVPSPIAMLPSLPSPNMMLPSPKAPQLKTVTPALPSAHKAAGHGPHLPGVSRLNTKQIGPLPPSSLKQLPGAAAPTLPPQSIGTVAGGSGFIPSPITRNEAPSTIAVPDVAPIAKAPTTGVQPVPMAQTRIGSAPSPVLPAIGNNFMPATIRQQVAAQPPKPVVTPAVKDRTFEKAIAGAPINFDPNAKEVAPAKKPATTAQTEKIAAEKLAAEKLAAEKLAAEKLAAEKLAAEKLAAEKLAAEKLAAEKLAAEKLAAEKLAAEKLAAKKIAAEKLAAEKLAAEKLAAEKLAAEKLAAEKLAAEKLAAEKLAAEKLAAEKLAAEKLAVEKIAAKKLAAEKLTAEKVGSTTTKTQAATLTPNTIAKSDKPVSAPAAATITKAPTAASNAPVADGTQVARMSDSLGVPSINAMPKPQFQIHIPTPQSKLPQVPPRTVRNETVQVPLAVSDLGDDVASPRVALLAFNSGPPPVIDEEVTNDQPQEESVPTDQRATVFIPTRTKAEELSPEKNKAAYTSMNKKLGKQDTNSSTMRLVPPLPSLSKDKNNPFGLDIKKPLIIH